MTAIGAASQSLTAASQRFDASATRTVQGGADLVAEAVEQVNAKTSFSAAAAVLRTSDQIMGGLLNILA